MKRDMDLVRSILKLLNEHEEGFAPHPFKIEGYEEELVGYHCHILNEAGLIKATDATSMENKSPFAIPISLTWSGHEFIENAQNDETWSQTKEVVSKVGDVSFSVWASVLSKVVMENLGISS